MLNVLRRHAAGEEAFSPLPDDRNDSIDLLARLFAASRQIERRELDPLQVEAVILGRELAKPQAVAVFDRRFRARPPMLVPGSSCSSKYAATRLPSSMVWDAATSSSSWYVRL